MGGGGEGVGSGGNFLGATIVFFCITMKHITLNEQRQTNWAQE